jgi:hypothetical protein
VDNPIVTLYKSQNGSMVNRIDFRVPQKCELTGLNRSGLNLKCGNQSGFDNRHEGGGDMW